MKYTEEHLRKANGTSVEKELEKKKENTYQDRGTTKDFGTHISGEKTTILRISRSFRALQMDWSKDSQSLRRKRLSSEHSSHVETVSRLQRREAHVLRRVRPKNSETMKLQSTLQTME